jgi:hypothetical protein
MTVIAAVCLFASGAKTPQGIIWIPSDIGVGMQFAADRSLRIHA